MPQSGMYQLIRLSPQSYVFSLSCHWLTQTCTTQSSSAERFAPPNFIHSTTSAALLSYVGWLPRTDLKATLLLLPFPRMPKPAPKILGHSDFSHLSDDEFQWSETVMSTVQKLLFVAVGENPDSVWHTPTNSKPTSGLRRAPVDSGMYI